MPAAAEAYSCCYCRWFEATTSAAATAAAAAATAMAAAVEAAASLVTAAIAEPKQLLPA
jgi:hypothetical protein